MLGRFPHRCRNLFPFLPHLYPLPSLGIHAQKLDKHIIKVKIPWSDLIKVVLQTFFNLKVLFSIKRKNDHQIKYTARGDDADYSTLNAQIKR